MTRKTTEQFIKEAKQIHGDKYDYSLVDYINCDKKVKIKCNKCGIIFEQIPYYHINRKQGCKCRKKEKLITVNFDTEFSNSNFREEYCKLINKAKTSEYSGITELHHILPKSLFPLWRNKKSNLIKLSLEDHYKAHYLLYKIYDNYEMTFAFKQMLEYTGKEYNPSLYKTLREEIILAKGRKVYCLEKNKEYDSILECCKENNLTYNYGVTKICTKKLWTESVKGLHFCDLKDKNKALEFWKKNKNKLSYGKAKRIYCLEKNKEYNSKEEIVKENNLANGSNVSTNCRNKWWSRTVKKLHYCLLEDKEEALKFWKENGIG